MTSHTHPVDRWHGADIPPHGDHEIPPGVAGSNGQNQTVKGPSTDCTDDWPEPQPLHRELPTPDGYPLEAFPRVLKGAADQIVGAIQAPIPIVGSSLLAAASLAVQAHADIKMPDGRVIPLSLYNATFGSSGERKTGVDDQALAPHRKQERALRQSYEFELEEHEVELAAWQKTRDEDLRKGKGFDGKRMALAELGPEPPPPMNPVLIVGEPTYEGLVKQLERGWPSIGLFSDEGGRFAGGHAWNKDNQIKTAAGLSDLWQGKPINRMRGGDGSSILYGRRVALHLMLQPSLMPLLFGDEMLAGQGLLARMLLSFPDSTIGTRKYKMVDLNETPEMRRYRDHLEDILKAPLPISDGKRNELSPRPLELSPKALKTWIGFHNHIEALQVPDRELFPVRAAASKSAEQALRLAGVITLVENFAAHAVPHEAMEAGVELAQYHLGESLRLHHGSKDNPDLILATTVLTWGRLQPGRRFCAVDLYQRGPGGVRDKAAAQNVMAILVDHGWVRRLPAGTTINGKARRESWEVRP